MNYLEIIPRFLSMYGVFTFQNTSQVRQEMSSSRNGQLNILSFFKKNTIHVMLLVTS